MDINVSTETPPAALEPSSDPVATLTVDAVAAATHAEAIVEIVEEKVDEVAAVVEMVAQETGQQINQLIEVKEWQSKTEGVLQTLLDSQIKMMEQQEALSLALAGLLTPPHLSEQVADGTPMIAPVNDALPSDPAQALPVQQAEQVLEKSARKIRDWI